MPRVVNQAEARRTHLLACARALVLERGCDAATIAELIDRAGMSKGGFYHHFPSKEALLEALIEQIAQEIVDHTQTRLRGADLDPLSQLNAFLDEGRVAHEATSPGLRATFAFVLHASDPALFRRLMAASARVIAPLLARIVEDGNARGVFSAPDAPIVIEVLFSLALGRRAVVMEALSEIERGEAAHGAARLARRIRLEENVLDRVLGVSDGSVRIGEPRIREIEFPRETIGAGRA